MAAAEEEKATEESGKKKKGGGKLKLIIIIVVLLIILGGGGFVAYKIFLAPKADPAAAGEVKKEAAPAGPSNEIGALFPMETFIVNMADNEGSRYLKVTIQLELNAKDEKATTALTDELTKRIPQLRDAILTILAAKRYEEVSSAQGKLILKQEILRRINSLLPNGEITNVYFTEFVSQ